MGIQSMHIHSTIWVTFQKEGIHHYPEALTEPNLADVSFLGHPHRHMFHFRVEIAVNHDNRDIEFIQFKRWCESLYDKHSGRSALCLDNASCEMMAKALTNEIIKEFGVRYMVIEVSEDGENGARVYTQPVPHITELHGV